MLAPRLFRWIRFSAREALPIAMQPADWLAGVLVGAKRLDPCSAVLRERLRKPLADVAFHSDLLDFAARKRQLAIAMLLYQRPF